MQRYDPRTGQITYLQHRDSDGRSLIAGDRVAYNRGGTATHGIIQRITKGGTTHILNTSRVAYWNGKVSKVKDCGDVLRIMA